MFAINGYSQKSIGVFAGYGTGVESLGIGGKFTFNLTDVIKNVPDAIRIAPGINYFFGTNEELFGTKISVSSFDVNLDAHYLFGVVDKFNVYPLVGLNYTFIRRALGGESDNVGKIGPRVGAGASYDLTDSLVLGTEAKYVLLSNASQVIFGLNFAYKF
jgi:outer membrane protein X